MLDALLTMFCWSLSRLVMSFCIGNPTLDPCRIREAHNHLHRSTPMKKHTTKQKTSMRLIINSKIDPGSLHLGIPGSSRIGPEVFLVVAWLLRELTPEMSSQTQETQAEKHNMGDDEDQYYPPSPTSKFYRHSQSPSPIDFKPKKGARRTPSSVEATFTVDNSIIIELFSLSMWLPSSHILCALSTIQTPRMH